LADTLQNGSVRAHDTGVQDARPWPAAANAPTSTAAPVTVRSPHSIIRALIRVLGTVGRNTIAVAAFLALWEIAPRVGLVDPTFLVPFSTAVRALWALAQDGQLWDDTRVSLVRSAVGFAIALGIGVPLGLVVGWYRTVAEILNPLFELFRNTAALALLPVFILILGIGETSKISIVVYACTFPILLNTITAVRGVDPTLVKSARSLGLSTPRIFRQVVLPASVPTIFTGVRMAAAASILVLIAAEMVGAKDGLGYLINASQQNFEIEQMYAGIIAISVIGTLVNFALVRLERRLTRWRPATH
jgi:NitT/TauT family transport system permease protein